MLHELQSAIRLTLGRQPDSGDLLLALAATPGTRAAAALHQTGIDLDTLSAAVDTVRSADGPTQAELGQRLGEIRAGRQPATRDQEYETAAQLRDEERELDRALRDAEPTPDASAAIWTRLGLSPPG